MINSMGYCPQCDDPIMTRNEKHQWVTRKSNFKSGYLIFESAPKIKINICETCYNAPDLNILSELINQDKNLIPETYKKYYNDNTVATGFEKI